MSTRIRVAVLDDYQNVALSMADWSPVTARADVTVFADHVADPDELVDAARAVRRGVRDARANSVAAQRPRASAAAADDRLHRAVQRVDRHGRRRGTRHSRQHAPAASVASTVELTWALILAASRHLVAERRRWPRGLADDGRARTGPPRARRARARAHRDAGGADRRGVRHGRRGVESEPDARGGRRGGRGALPAARRVLRHRRRADRPPQAERTLPRPDRRRGALGDETDCAAGQYVTRPDRRRGRADRRAACRDRSRAPASTSSTPNRCPPTIRCARWPTCSATPHIGYVADRPYEIFFRDAVAAIAAWLDDNA